MADHAVRVALVARVSTEMQAEEGFSIAAQLDEMREFCAKRGWTVVTEFVDAGYSGSTLDRPGIQSMLAALETKAFDVVLVHELSRLSRSIFDTFAIFEQLGMHGVGFASVKEPDFDFSHPTGRLFLTILAALNQYYLDLLKMHTAKGKRARAREGLYNASIVPFGYKASGDPKTPPSIDPETAEGVKLLFEKYSTTKYSDEQLADMMNDRGFRTALGRRFVGESARDILNNRFYMGQVVYGTKHKGEPIEYFPGRHEPIVSEDLFNICQEVRQKRARGSRAYQSAYRVYLLNGLAVCDMCRRTLRVQASRDNRYYREMSRLRGFLDCPNAQLGVRGEELEQQVSDFFRLLKLPEDWQDQLESLLDREEDVLSIERKRERLEAEGRRLNQLYVNGHFGDDFASYEREKRRIKRELDTLPPVDVVGVERAAETLERLSEVWDDADVEDQRDLLRIALDQVLVDVSQGRVMGLVPYAPFVPLFRAIPTLVESEPGTFLPLLPPEMADKPAMGSVLPPVTTPPDTETAVRWPIVLTLPPPDEHVRTMPVISKFLKGRRIAGQPLKTLAESVHPGVPPLLIDKRQWPGVQAEAISLDPDRPELPYGDGSVSFLRTPYIFQPAGNKLGWLDEADRVLDLGGWWLMEDLMPESMPLHWLYHFFPNAREVDKEKSLGPKSWYMALFERGYQVTMTRKTYEQAISLQMMRQIVEDRQRTPELAGISDVAYQAGIERIESELAAKGEAGLWPSHFCTVQVVATKGQRQPYRRRNVGKSED